MKKEFVKEVALMAELRSQNIVQILGSYSRLTELVILMEYCSQGSLREKLNRFAAGTEPGKWGKEEQIRMLLDISYGMEYLHNKRIVHQDLKSLNILIDARGKGKVADFGKVRAMLSLILKDEFFSPLNSQKVAPLNQS